MSCAIDGLKILGRIGTRFFWSKRSDLFFGSEYTEDQYEEKDEDDEATHAMIYDTTQCICNVYSFKCILMYLYM